MLNLINFESSKLYSFNLDLWFSQFDDHSSFFKEWYNILQHSAQLSPKPIATNYYQYALTLGSQTLFLHFNIERILSIPYNHKNISPIMINSIGTPDENLTYIFSPTPKEENNLIHLFTAKPIVLCPIPSDYGCKFIVLDGNHRVTIKKQFHFKNVNALFYISESTNDFATPFEYNMYKFLHELFQKLYR